MRDSRNESSLDWSERLIESISSRKSVPPSATSSKPGLAARASVKAPFSYPNISDSRRLSGSAAQLISRNRPAAHREA